MLQCHPEVCCGPCMLPSCREIPPVEEPRWSGTPSWASCSPQQRPSFVRGCESSAWCPGTLCRPLELRLQSPVGAQQDALTHTHTSCRVQTGRERAIARLFFFTWGFQPCIMQVNKRANAHPGSCTHVQPGSSARTCAPIRTPCCPRLVWSHNPQILLPETPFLMRALMRAPFWIPSSPNV